MKKILIIIAVIFVLFVAALIAIPFLFKGQLVEVIKKEANKNILATLDFTDVHLSLLNNFPNLSVSIDDLSLVGGGGFAIDTLAAIRQIQASVNLKSLIFGEQIQINSFKLSQPRILVLTARDGRFNWDIFPAEAADSLAQQEAAPTAMNLAIRRYEIQDGHILYADEMGGIFMEIAGLNHQGRGDFRRTLFILNTQTDVEKLTVQMGGVPYIDKAELAIKADLEVDAEHYKFTLKKNEFRLNNLYLALDGWAAQVTPDSLELDIAFRSPNSDFKDILSMIPYIYRRDYESLEASGALSLEGWIKGVSTPMQIPAFEVNLAISNGMFKYADLPTPVKDVQMNLQITNPGKTLDETVVNLRKLHLAILNDIFEAQFQIKTPLSDPFMDGYFKGGLNLAEVQNLLPTEEKLDLKGLVNCDFRIKGNKSAFEKGRTDRASASGTISCSNIEYAAPDLPGKLRIDRAILKISAQKAALEGLDLKFGQSDIRAEGALENIIGFVIADQVLTGNLNLNSTFCDLNPWLAMDTTSQTLTPIELPDKVEFAMKANFGTVNYDKMVLTGVAGDLLLKNKVLTLKNLSANTLEGSISTSGSYSYLPPQYAHIDFDMNISSMSIPEMYKTFVTIQKAAPLANNLKGELSGQIKLNSDLGDSLMPVWDSLSSQGSLHIPQAKIENLEALNKIADALKIAELRNPTLYDFKPSYHISDGRFYLHPVSFKLGEYQVSASGSNGFDKSLDYKLSIQVPAAAAKKQANQAISQLIKQDISLLSDETVVVDIKVKGTVQDPKIETSLAEIVKGTADQLKQAALKEAEEKRKQLEQQAKTELERKKKEAEEKLKAELDKKKKEEEEKLKNKLKGLFK